MSTSISQRIASISRKLRNRVNPSQGLILVYHHVAQSQQDPWEMFVSPANFEEHLQVLAKYYCPLPLNDFVESAKTGSLPKGAVAITFDDGYADNLVAANLLQAHAIPATLFVISNSIGQRSPFWWDRLEALLLHQNQLPGSLRIEDGGQTFEWELGEAAAPPSNQYNGPTWFAPPNSRSAFHYTIWQHLRLQSPKNRLLQLDAIEQWSGVHCEQSRLTDTLDSAAIRSIAETGIVSIGAHTANHEWLPGLEKSVIVDEMSQSKLALESLLDRPVEGFAYPFGEFDERCVQAASEAGFDYAVSTVGSSVNHNSRTFALPRLSVGDWPGPFFENFLTKWFSVPSTN